MMARLQQNGSLPAVKDMIDIIQDDRFMLPKPPPMHPRALTIEAALKECARLPAQEFALIVLLENGEEETYTSQSLIPYQSKIFSNRFQLDFRRNIRQAIIKGKYAGPERSIEAEFNADDDSRQQSNSGDSLFGDSINGKRKRAQRFDDENTPVPVPIQTFQQLIISNEKEVEQFYNVRFKDMQQSSCKVMGKAFVKLIGPKKQTHHPYTMGNANPPPWWPTGDNHVRHKEPDHLLKSERIRLLVHILKLIIEPYHKQCPTVQRLGLNIKKLEEVTIKAMNNWLNDPENPQNAAKKPLLREIFKVAKVEEGYKNGDIDGDTCVPIICGDKNGQDFSDNKVEEGEPESTQISNMPTPDSLVFQPMIQNKHLQETQETESNPMLMSATHPLPVQYHTKPQIDEHKSYSNSSYLRTVGFQPQSPNSQDSTRRSFGSPVYGWQNITITNGRTPSNHYMESPQTTVIPRGGQFQLYSSPTTTQPIPHFDSQPSGGLVDSGPVLGNQLRIGSLGHPHHMLHGFQEYL